MKTAYVQRSVYEKFNFNSEGLEIWNPEAKTTEAVESSAQTPKNTTPNEVCTSPLGTMTLEKDLTASIGGGHLCILKLTNMLENGSKVFVEVSSNELYSKGKTIEAPPKTVVDGGSVEVDNIFVPDVGERITISVQGPRDDEASHLLTCEMNSEHELVEV